MNNYRPTSHGIVHAELSGLRELTLVKKLL